ncbi:cyclin-like protein [Piromyces finnis]|uniref:Cyclin-like protein n=1 Tax=Piromyces finnis TaxID=1754191 RepID=A0A1Y1V7F6_9FUNG|nr:cyclin-like protein [Piromyces finnis]|eukprot:ORX47823.1 cyclin-like protein [Piromyces finnis]
MQRENNWLFTKEEIENSPSRNFMSLSKENDTRRIACKFIQHVARAPRINLSRTGIITAQMLLHRYYMRKSFSDNNPWDVSIGAIFLASKLVSEYSSRISKYLIHECARVAKKIHDPKYELNPNEKEYGYWKNNMNYYEMEILRIVSYDLTFQEPYSYCSTYCEKINASKEVKAISCYLIDESYIRTTLCLQYSAKTIAAGSLLLSLFQDNFSESLKHETLRLFRENHIPLMDVKAVANILKSMILKMDESNSPVHSNEIKHNTHASTKNGYSKVCYINNIIIYG